MDEVCVGLATVDVETLKAGVVLLDSLLEPVDEGVGDFNIAFFVGPILVALVALSSLGRGRAHELVD